MSKKLFKNRRKIPMSFLERGSGRDSDRKRRVIYPVWQRRCVSDSTMNASADTESFKWPEYKTEHQRIWVNTNKFMNTDISSAFAEAYNVPVTISEERYEIVNSAPKPLNIGDTIMLPLVSVTKDHVEFDSLNYKQFITTNTNLYRFETFRKFTPKDPLKTKVIAITPERITVDPLAPILDEWLNPILANPKMQKKIGDEMQTIKVKNLRLTRGGFVGRAVIPSISKYVGEEYTIEAFIPGSQIVLNIEQDFSRWEGKTVEAFVTSYIPKPNTINQMSLICSVKEQLKFQGEKNLIELFKLWCDADEGWKKVAEKKYMGRVTGVIHSSKKCGVFVEIPELLVTGMIPVAPDQLVNYKPQDQVTVSIADIEEDMYYDDVSGQMCHSQPYIINNGILEKCSLKPVLKFAE